MRKVVDSFELSATDLVGYLHCHHLTALDRAVAEGALAKPKVWDPLLQILSERGAAHEQAYVEYLTRAGLDVIRIDGVEVANEPAAETLAAMRRVVCRSLSKAHCRTRAGTECRRPAPRRGAERVGRFAASDKKIKNHFAVTRTDDAALAASRHSGARSVDPCSLPPKQKFNAIGDNDGGNHVDAS